MCRVTRLQFSCSVMSDSLRSHGLQHARLPYPPPTLEHAQTHVHRVSDAIQPSHLLSSPSPPAFSLSQHQDLFQWVNSSYQVAKVLELQLQPFQWTFRLNLLYDWLVWSPCCPRDSQESSPAPQFGNQHFFSPQHSLWSNSHICTWLREKS